MTIDAARLRVVVGADTGPAERNLNSFSTRLENTAQRAQRAGRTMSLGFTAPILGLGAAVGAIGIDFESAFAGVVKTVDATEEELAMLERGIRDMALEIPTAASELADIAAAAGQLGIETDAILGFTRTMADLGVATNLAGEEAATALARFANITGMPQDQFDNLGSTIVALGNNLATTEREIVDMALRLAAAGSQIGLSESQIVSFAAALSSVGIAAESGGTAFSRVMIEMANAVAGGTENLGRFARVAGMSTAQFQTAFEQDAAGAIIAFIEGLGELSAAGENVFPILEELGLSEVRVRDALLRAAGAGDLFTEALQIGSQAWEENTALANEAAQRYATTASQLQTLASHASELGIVLFQHVQPGLQASLGRLTEFAAGVTEMVSGLVAANPQLVNAGLAFAGILAAAGPALLAISGVAAALGFMLSPLGAVTLGVASLAAAWTANLGGMRTATMTAIEGMRPGFETLMGWLNQARKGDLSGVSQGLQLALGRIETTIEQFSWSDYVTEFGEWSEFIVSLEWVNFVPDLAWDIYVASLSWPDFVQDLAWTAYVEALLWSHWVQTLTWESFVTEMVDWGTYIAVLPWNTFVRMLDWSAYIGQLAWSEWLSEVDWSAVIGEFGEWNAFVTELDWGQYVTELSDWGQYITVLTWNSYVEKLEWPQFVSAIDWSIFAPQITWSDFIPQLTWSGVVTTAVDWATYIPALAWNNYLRALNWGLYVTSVLWNAWISTLDWTISVVPLAWDAFVGALRWADFITNLSWPLFIGAVLEWSSYVSKISWADHIETLADWIRFVPELAWSSFVEKVEWPEGLTNFSWSEYVSRFAWPDAVQNFDWSGYVVPLLWPASITNFTWDGWLTELSWSEFISELQWPEIPPFSLDNWLSDLEWDEFIEDFRWPRISDVEWEDFIPRLSWPDIPRISWSDFIPNFSWPSVPEIDWADFIPTFVWGSSGAAPVNPTAPNIGTGGTPQEVPDTNQGSGVGGNALGTAFFRGGMALVGEQGRELVSLPRGSRIFSNGETEALLAGAGDINIGPVYVNDQTDIELLARRIQELLQRRGRA